MPPTPQIFTSQFTTEWNTQLSSETPRSNGSFVQSDRTLTVDYEPRYVAPEYLDETRVRPGVYIQEGEPYYTGRDSRLSVVGFTYTHSGYYFNDDYIYKKSGRTDLVLHDHLPKLVMPDMYHRDNERIFGRAI